MKTSSRISGSGGVIPKRFAALVRTPQRLGDQRRADAGALPVGRHAHRAELEHAGALAEPDVAQQHVADDAAFDLRDE